MTPVAVEELPAFFDHLPAGVLAKIADMRFRQRQMQKVRKPKIGVLLAHETGFVQPVKIAVRRSAKRAKLGTGKRTYRNIGPGVNAHIGITFRIMGADIELHPARIVL